MIIERKSIPKDWDLISVEDCFDILDNQRKPLNESERNLMRGDIPYYGANGVVDYVNEFLFDDDLILIAEDGGYFDEFQTRPIAYKVKGKAWINNHAHVLKAKNGYYQDYLFYCLEHKNILIWLNGGTRAKLNKGDLEKLPIQIATHPEQKAIAHVLSTADAAIHTTEKLIAQKELRKKWLMQQLLTGKKRLKGFDGVWLILKIKNIGIVPEKKPITKVDNQKLLTVKLHTKGIEFNEREKPVISSTGRPYYERNEGEILIGRQNIHNGGIGLVTKEFDGHICSNAISSFKVNDNHSTTYLLFHLQYPSNYHRIEDYMGGTGQKELSEKQFLDIPIKLPKSKEEQTAIAQVLQAADKEISLLKAKADKLREQKKGLMQVLLTGKVRLNIDKAKLAQ